MAFLVGTFEKRVADPEPPGGRLRCKPVNIQQASINSVSICNFVLLPVDQLSRIYLLDSIVSCIINIFVTKPS